MAKKKSNHVIQGMNAAKAQGQGAGFNEEHGLELTPAEKLNNKKRKKNQ